MVYKDGDSAVGVQTKEPVLFLFVGHNVARKGKSVKESYEAGYLGEGIIHQCLRPLCSVDVVKLLEHDLNLLAIGCALGD